MNTLEELFPEKPSYKGSWQTIYLEPIVGSGECVSIAVVARGDNGQFRVVQAIRTELLDCLYGVKAQICRG